MINEIKQPNHVLGNKISCPNFTQCPICYGCRSYSSSMIECEKCLENKKRDVCNTALHRSDLIEKLVSKNNIIVDKNYQFISAENKEE